MRNKKISFLFFSLVTVFYCIKNFTEKRLPTPATPKVESLSESQSNSEAQLFRKYSLGFDDALLTLFWIEILQAAPSRVSQFAEGEVSWEFNQLNKITTLDPRFVRAYTYGASALNVMVKDKLGNLRLLEKWARNHNDSWRAHYLLGQIYYDDWGKFELASQHILKAASSPKSPTWLAALGIRLLSETGSLVKALRLSLELISMEKNDDVKERLAMRIRNLNASLQESAWKSALVKYRALNRKEPNSINDLKSIFPETIREVASTLSDVKVQEDTAKLLKESFPFRYDPNSRTIMLAANKEDLDLDQVGIFVPRRAAK